VRGRGHGRAFRHCVLERPCPVVSIRELGLTRAQVKGEEALGRRSFPLQGQNKCLHDPTLSRVALQTVTTGTLHVVLT
jgi:hypothetical protein